MPIRFLSCFSTPLDLTSFLHRRGKSWRTMHISVDKVWLPWELTSFRQRGHEQFFLGEVHYTNMARTATPHTLRSTEKVYVLQGTQLPWQQTNLAQAQTWKQDTVSPFYNWDVSYKIKNRSYRIILILNLCLQVCKDDVRSPLPSASIVTCNGDVVWVALTAPPKCSRRAFHLSCFYHHSNALKCSQFAKRKLNLLLSTIWEQNPDVRAHRSHRPWCTQQA